MPPQISTGLLTEGIGMSERWTVITCYDSAQEPDFVTFEGARARHRARSFAAKRQGAILLSPQMQSLIESEVSNITSMVLQALLTTVKSPVVQYNDVQQAVAVVCKQVAAQIDSTVILDVNKPVTHA